MLEQQSKMLSKDSAGFHVELFRNEDAIVKAMRKKGLAFPEFHEPKKSMKESTLADVSYDLDVLEAEVKVKAHQRKTKTGKIEDVDAHTRTVVYHGTRDSVLDSILAKGLIPQNYSNWNWNLDDKPEDVVYVSKSLKEAIDFGKAAASYNPKAISAAVNPKTTWAVIEAHVPTNINMEKDKRVESGNAFILKEVNPKWFKKIHFYGLTPKMGVHMPVIKRTVDVNETVTSFTKVYIPLPINHLFLKKKKLSEAQVRVKAHARVRKGRQQFVNTYTRENKTAQKLKLIGVTKIEETTIRKILERHDEKILKNIPVIGVLGGNNFAKAWKVANADDSSGAKGVAGFYSEKNGMIILNRDTVRTFGWRSVLDHEIGHSAYYHSKNAPNWVANTMSDRSFDRFTRYSREGTHEAFAESYMAYMSAGGKAKNARFKRVFNSINDVISGVHNKNYWKSYRKFIEPSIEMDE